MRRLAAVLGLIVLVGCPRGPRKSDGRVARGQLNFAREDDAARFDSVTACFAMRHGWHSRPLRADGASIAAQWCSWGGSCSAPRHEEPQQPGALWAEVGTQRLPGGEFPMIDVAGAHLSVGERQSQGWSVRLSVHGGEQGLRDGAVVVFSPPDPEGDEFSVGLSYAWMVMGTEFNHDLDEDPWAWLARVRSSPEALREEGLTGWTKVHTQVVQALDAGTLRKCLRMSQGAGGTPTCAENVPLSADEVASQRARIDARLASVKAGMSQVDTLHARLIKLAPLNCF